MKKLVNLAFYYAALALAGGVFYREFTKFNGFEGRTTLVFVHLHAFVLGSFFLLLLLLLDSVFKLRDRKSFAKFLIIYNIGLHITLGTFIWRGILQVLEIALPAGQSSMISGIAGLGHILLGSAIIAFFVLIKKQVALKEGVSS